MHIRKTTLLIGPLAACLFSTAFGQSSGGQDSQGSDDIYTLLPFQVQADQTPGYQATSSISASRINVPLKELPMNIPVLTKDFIQDVTAFGHREVLRWNPAVNDKAVRGFNTDEFLRNGFLHLSDFSQHSIQRIEIIRGPSAVLQGTTSPGGVINIIPKTAVPNTDFREAVFQYGFGPRSLYSTMFDINSGNLGPQTEDGHLLAFRMIGSWEYTEPLTRYGTRELTTASPSLRITPSKKTSFLFEYYDYDLNADREDRLWGAEMDFPNRSFEAGEVPIGAAFPEQVGLHVNWGGPDQDIPEQVNEFYFSADHSFTDYFHLTFAYDRHSRELDFVPGAGQRLVAAPGVSDPSRSNIGDWRVARTWFYQENDALFKQWRLSGLLTADWGETRHRFIFGHQFSDFYRTNDRRDGRLTSDPSKKFTELFRLDTYQTDDLSLTPSAEWLWVPERFDINTTDRGSSFFNHQGKWFNDRLITLWGVYTADIDTFNTRASYDLDTDTWGPQDPRLDDEVDTTLPQFGFIYGITKQVGLFANYSQSTLPTLGKSDGFGNGFPAGKATIREIGVKFDAFEAKVNGTFSAYVINDEGRIVFDPNAPNEDSVAGIGPPGANVQVGEVESRGADLDLWFNPMENWTGLFGYSYNDSEVVNDPDPTRVGDGQNGGFKHKFVFWTKYNFVDGPLDGWFVGGGMHRKSKTLRSNNRGGMPAYDEPVTRADMMFGYQGSLGETLYEVRVNVRNLTKSDNASNGLPRRDLQNGWKPGTNERFVFDGEIEYVISTNFKF